MFFSDHGTPDGWRHNHGYGCHTFKWSVPRAPIPAPPSHRVIGSTRMANLFTSNTISLPNTDRSNSPVQKRSGSLARIPTIRSRNSGKLSKTERRLYGTQRSRSWSQRTQTLTYSALTLSMLPKSGPEVNSPYAPKSTRLTDEAGSLTISDA